VADNITIKDAANADKIIRTDDVNGGGVHAQIFRLDLGTDTTEALATSTVPVSATNLDVRDLAQTQDNVKVGDGTSFIDIDTAPTDGETNGGKRLLHTEAWLWGYNGTSWDRLRSDQTNGLDVDVTRLPSLVAGNANIGDVDVATVPAPLSTSGGGTEAAALRVTIATDSTGVVSVDDNASSLTVDATDLDIRNLTHVSDSVNIGDGTDLCAISTAAADGESNSVNRLEVEAYEMGFNGTTWDRKRWGSHTWKCVQSTTATTTNIWTPGSGKKIVLTALQIQAGGTTAGTVQVWFAASGDTSYGRGTDAPVFDGEFAPSNTLKPGVYVTFPFPLVCPTADYLLKVTTSAAINPLTVTAWGFEI